MTTREHPIRRLGNGGRSPAVVGLLLGVTVLACSGCSEDWQAATYPARGKIAVNGEAPEGAVVELHSSGKQPDVRNSRPWAVVGADGSFALSTYEKGDGAPAGVYKVVVRWPPDVNQPSLADRLKGAYARPEKSPWTVTVAEGENELPAIEITGAKVLPKGQAGSPRGGPPGPPRKR